MEKPVLDTSFRNHICGRSYKNQSQKFENLTISGRLDAGNNLKTSTLLRCKI